MFKGKGIVLLRNRPLIQVRYWYELSRLGDVWEGYLTADMRGLDRDVFYSPLSLKCLSGQFLDLRITTYSDQTASFKGTSLALKRTSSPATCESAAAERHRASA